MEQPKWHSPQLETWKDFVDLRTFRPCSAPDNKKTETTFQYYEFDYYPCSFWLQEGSTHSKMHLQLQIAPVETDSKAPIYYPEHYKEDDSKWSTALQWNTLEEYKDDKQKQEIVQRIVDMSTKDQLPLDGHTKNLEERLKE